MHSKLDGVVVVLHAAAVHWVATCPYLFISSGGVAPSSSLTSEAIITTCSPNRNSYSEKTDSNTLATIMAEREIASSLTSARVSCNQGNEKTTHIFTPTRDVIAQLAMASDSSPPSDVRDWLATPAPFNVYKHGERAIFSGDDSIVERREAEDDWWDCVVYTREPLPLGHVWQTTVLNTTRRVFLGGLVSGCVLCFL